VLLTDGDGNRYAGRVVGVRGSKGCIIKVGFKPNIPGQVVNSVASILCGEGVPVSRVALMSVGEVSTYRRAIVSPSDPIEYVRRVMRDYGYRLVVVVDSSGRVLGVIGRAEVLLTSSTKSEALASHVMREPLITLREDQRVGEALKSMLEVDEWYAPVTDRGFYKTLFGLEDAIERALKIDRDKAILEGVELREIMSVDVVIATVDDSVDRVWRLMMEHRYAGIPVVDRRGALIGIVTQYDLLKKGYARPHLEAEKGPGKTPKVRNVMTRPCTHLYPWSKALEAATIMVNRNIGRIPVVESDKTRKIIGIVDREDIVKLLTSRS
jgi:CBS domain-containing protein